VRAALRRIPDGRLLLAAQREACECLSVLTGAPAAGFGQTREYQIEPVDLRGRGRSEKCHVVAPCSACAPRGEAQNRAPSLVSR
jgi:hypothetical protein